MNQINLMDAYVIETLRSSGVSNTQIIEAADQKTTDQFNEIKDGMDYGVLDRFYSEDRLNSILTDGYQVTFLTSNGLKNLIRMKYNQKADEDFTFDNFVVEGLQISKPEAEELQSLLSQNWVLSSADNGIRIAPVSN